jgi:hypothetical protein
MTTILDKARKVQRGETPPPPIGWLPAYRPNGSIR